MRIGVFDSGVGGITVLSELYRRLPGAGFVYLGDTAHVPYGTKSPAQIEQLSRQCALILRAKSVDAVVVACNTASSLALPAIRAVMGDIPVFGMVEPGVAAVRSAAKGDSSVPILVLATRATVRSGAYGRSLRLADESHPVFEQACPLLVPMIEEGWVDHPILHQTLQEYVAAFTRDLTPGVALLGCTHYPWIIEAFRQALPGWTVINSAEAVATQLMNAEFWRKFAAKPRARVVTSAGAPSRVEWLFTDPDAVPAFASRLMSQWPLTGEPQAVIPFEGVLCE